MTTRKQETIHMIEELLKQVKAKSDGSEISNGIFMRVTGDVMDILNNLDTSVKRGWRVNPEAKAAKAAKAGK
jgi:hypothetical protein